MKKTLILVRHATAEDQTLMIRDFQRELVGKGKSDAMLIGKWLAERQMFPDRFLTSSAPRACQTAVLVAEQLKFDRNAIVQNTALYDGGPRAYLSAVNSNSEESASLILFGHNPDITYFAEYLSGADIGSMSKCSVVILEIENFAWSEVSSKTCSFISYTSPKQLREIN
jgi:phosphohistidine phosphatase